MLGPGLKHGRNPLVGAGGRQHRPKGSCPRKKHPSGGHAGPGATTSTPPRPSHPSYTAGQTFRKRKADPVGQPHQRPVPVWAASFLPQGLCTSGFLARRDSSLGSSQSSRVSSPSSQVASTEKLTSTICLVLLTRTLLFSPRTPSPTVCSPFP